MQMTPGNPFRMFWDLGYRRLVPVVPPGVPLFDKSNLAARLRVGDDSRGKAPGVLRQDGSWQGMSFVKMEAREDDLDVWHSWGASVGVKTGNGLIAPDIDTTDTVAAKRLHGLATEILGPAPIRFGRKPKCLLLYQGPTDLPYMQMRFSTATEQEARLEILTEGRQFVAHGTHPKTGQPYQWPQGLIARDDLTRVTQEQVDEFMREAVKAFPSSTVSAASAGAEAADPEDLRAPSWDALERAVKATPNTSAMFPSRDSYVRMAYAIKAAAPAGYEDEACDLYLDWAVRWEDPGDGQEPNDPDIALADWNRAKPPFRTGFSFIQENAVGLYFSPVVTSPVDDMFDAVTPTQPRPRGITLLTDRDIQQRPTLKWLIRRHIPEDGFGILYGDPGSGKSFLVLDMALHIATGKAAWHGDEITGGNGGAVLYIAGEGAGDIKARIQAWKQVNMPEGGFIPDDRFRVIIEPLNFMHTDDMDRLLEAVKAAGLPKLALIVVDTVSRAIPGADENTQKDMTIFLGACDRLRHATGAFVLGVHHSGKSGDLRGSTAIPGGADAIFRFERKKGQMVGRLECMKMKAGPDDVSNAYRLEKVPLFGAGPVEGDEVGEGVGSSLVPQRLDDEEAGAVAAVCTEEMQSRIFRAVGAAWEAGAPWSTSPQSGTRYAVRRIAMDFEVRADVAEQWLSLWLDGPERVLEMAVYDRKSKMRGLRVAPAKDEERDILS